MEQTFHFSAASCAVVYSNISEFLMHMVYGISIGANWFNHSNMNFLKTPRKEKRGCRFNEWNFVKRQLPFWLFEIYALFIRNKFLPVLPFCILLWSLFTFLAIASKTLSARTFGLPRLKYLRNCMSCFNSPKEPSAWMLLFVRSRIPSSERILSKSFFRYFRNVFATERTLLRSSIGVLQLFPLMQSFL